MRLSSCGQVWKRGAKKKKLKKDAHAWRRVEAGAIHPPKPLGAPCAPRATLHTKGEQGLPPRRVERGVCSMVKRPPRVFGSARGGSCASTSGRRPVVAPTATASGACKPAAFKRSSLGLAICTPRSDDTERSNRPATGSPRVALPRDRASGSPVVTWPVAARQKKERGLVSVLYIWQNLR